MNEKTTSFLSLRIRLWGLLTAAGVVGCCATVTGFLGRFSWFLDLFSHFRVQYLLSLVLLGLILLVARRRKTAAVFAAFACANLGVIAPMYFGGGAPAAETTHPLRAMLLNVNTELGDAKRVQQAIQEIDPDILVLEEISSRWFRDLRWLAEAYPYSCVETREDNFGIGLFSNLPLVEDQVVYIGDAEVPSILATVDTGRGQLRVIATHPLPPGGAEYSRWRNDQLERLPDHIQSSSPTIVLGDLNVSPWNYHFKRLLKRTGLLDSCRGRGIQPTWPSYNPLFLIPIDHCLHSPGVFIVGRRIGPGVGSDHYPVIVDLAIGAQDSSLSR